MEHQPEALKIWHDIAVDCNIEHWSNVEVFECCAPYIDETSRCAADPDRIVLQINNAAEYCTKLITWELLYYGNAELNPAGQPFIKRLFGNK
jgi:hypothetical protein